MHFEKDRAGTLYLDRRTVDVTIGGQRTVVQPDVMGDFRCLPFADASFDRVVFDPPHAFDLSPTSSLGAKYGQLFDTWEDDLRSGFAECFRVLQPHGTLVFKWADTSVPLARVLALTDRAPLFGSRSGKSTHWVVFAGV